MTSEGDDRSVDRRAGKGDELWCYRRLAEVFSEQLEGNWLADELLKTVAMVKANLAAALGRHQDLFAALLIGHAQPLPPTTSSHHESCPESLHDLQAAPASDDSR